MKKVFAFLGKWITRLALAVFVISMVFMMGRGMLQRERVINVTAEFTCDDACKKDMGTDSDVIRKVRLLRECQYKWESPFEDSQPFYQAFWLSDWAYRPFSDYTPSLDGGAPLIAPLLYGDYFIHNLSEEERAKGIKVWVDPDYVRFLSVGLNTATTEKCGPMPSATDSVYSKEIGAVTP